MLTTIQAELRNVEDDRSSRVLYACESGSRAWGFASPDSDYDVRFVYVHNPEYYLRLEQQRDTMLFSELVEAELGATIRPAVNALLLEKAEMGELGGRPRIDSLNAWIERAIAEIEGQSSCVQRQEKLPWGEFDAVFLSALGLG